MSYITLRPSKYRYTLNSSETSKQLATAACELVNVVVTGGSGGAALRIIDSAAGAAEAGPGPQNMLISANGGESSAPLLMTNMTKGLYIELEQGGSGNSEATVFYN